MLKPIRRVTPLALALITGLTLTSCGLGAKPEQEQPELTPQQKLEQEAGVVIEPGYASCEFNNELKDHDWDGSGEHPFGQLDTVEVQETETTYDVTFTGEFFDPSLLTDDSNMNMQVQLIADNNENSISLYTGYWKGEVELTGVVVTEDGAQEEQELETSPKLESGKFTASYPKEAVEEIVSEPAMWVASMYFASGDEDEQPISFRCGDGRNWNWEPLGS